MVTITLPSTRSRDEHFVKFDSAMLEPVRSKPRQVSTVSLMTTETCATETSSLTDEEEEVPEESTRDQTKAEFDVSHLLDDLLMVVVSTRDEPLSMDNNQRQSNKATATLSYASTSNTNSTSKRSSLPPAEVRQSEDVSTEQKVDLWLRKTKNHSSNPRSILKRCGMDIPIKNKGWKNLPKLANLPQNIATTRTRNSGTLRRSVRFQAVVVRCYDQCIGDNPAVSYGTPISLDWYYEQMAPIDLEAYESSRTVRRTPRQMMMNYYNRRNVLMHRFGFLENEIVEGENAANKIRSQRSVTRALLPAACFEDMLSSVGRKAKRRFGKAT